jgi:gluconolactonase
MTAGPNPIDGFVVDASSISYVGDSLQRPECILAERDGSLWAADARGGVVQIRPTGSQRLILQSVANGASSYDNKSDGLVTGTLPNGLAFARNGDILIANFGTDRLEVMSRAGETRVLVDQIDGEPIGKVNFVLRDKRNRRESRQCLTMINGRCAQTPVIRRRPAKRQIEAEVRDPFAGRFAL